MFLNILITSLEQGLGYALMALGVYLTFRVLDFPDLTVDGSFPLGAAITARLIVSGVDPFVATVSSLFFGALAGVMTGFLNTQLKITGLLAGILTMTALYSVNLRIMGRSNLPLLREPTILRTIQDLGISRRYVALITFVLVVLFLKFLLDYFLYTELGMALRATGYNPKMIQSLGVNTPGMVILGLAFANALVALSGSLVAQYQGFSDVGMGIGMIIIGLASVIIGESILRTRKIVGITFGVLLGSILYRFAVTLALRFGFSPTDLKLITALLVIVALSAPVLRQQQTGMRRTLLKGKGREVAPDVAFKEGSESVQPGSD